MSVEEAFWGRYLSKRTERRLKTAAQETKRNDDDELIAKIESHVSHLETVDAEFYGPDIAAAREFLARFRGYAETRVFADVPDRIGDDQEGS